jgi:hypothetical protein
VLPVLAEAAKLQPELQVGYCEAVLNDCSVTLINWTSITKSRQF